MKPILFVIALSVLWSVEVLAQSGSYNITVERKRFDVERAQTESTATSKEKWGFAVTIENKSFKDQKGLQVEYRLFMKDVPVGAKAAKMAVKRTNGTTTIAELKNGAKHSFDTDTVDIEKSQLIGGWRYTDGAKPRQADSLEGIWVRVYLEGKVVGEFTYPSSIKTKETWDPK